MCPLQSAYQIDAWILRELCNPFGEIVVFSDSGYSEDGIIAFFVFLQKNDGL
jgi:hypothetical protein